MEHILAFDTVSSELSWGLIFLLAFIWHAFLHTVMQGSIHIYDPSNPGNMQTFFDIHSGHFLGVGLLPPGRQHCVVSLNTLVNQQAPKHECVCKSTLLFFADCSWRWGGSDLEHLWWPVAGLTEHWVPGKCSTLVLVTVRNQTTFSLVCASQLVLKVSAL